MSFFGQFGPFCWGPFWAVLEVKKIDVSKFCGNETKSSRFPRALILVAGHFRCFCFIFAKPSPDPLPGGQGGRGVQATPLPSLAGSKNTCPSSTVLGSAKKKCPFPLLLLF